MFMRRKIFDYGGKKWVNYIGKYFLYIFQSKKVNSKYKHLVNKIKTISQINEQIETLKPVLNKWRYNTY